MKYQTILDTDDYIDFEFFEDGNGKYMVGKDAGITASGGWMPLYFTECTQESILDKIKEEIEREANSGKWSKATMYGMLNAVVIIDKYKSEDKE